MNLRSVGVVETGVDALVDHLAGLGHRSLLHLSGPETSWISRRRWEHLLQTSTERDLAIVEVGPTVRPSRRAT